MIIEFPQASLQARLAWHGFEANSEGPFFFRLLNDAQKALFHSRFEETSRRDMVGETSASVLGILFGLIFGNRLTRVVQCGHYAGHSLLMTGMIAKSIGAETKVASIDIDQVMTRFTNEWVSKCGLDDIAKTFILDSADVFSASAASSYLGGAPELVFIDSSHQYRHTLKELDLWSSQVAPGGFICLHDAAEFSSYQDHEDLGGVSKALSEWRAAHPEVTGLVLQSNLDGAPVFRDPCGLSILQIMNPSSFVAPRPTTAKRMISDPNFGYADQWDLGDGWLWLDGVVQKRSGVSSSISCFAPVVAGEKYRIKATLADVVSGGLHPGAGGGDLADFFSSNGEHSADVVAAQNNSLIGLLASSDFQGKVLNFDALHLA